MTGFGDATSDEDADPKGTRLVAIGRVVVEGRGIRAQSAALAQDEETPPVAPDARPRGMAAGASALVQSTLAGFLK